MPWPPALALPREHALVGGTIRWEKRGRPFLTVVLERVFALHPNGTAEPVAAGAGDALSPADCVAFRLRTDVLLTASQPGVGELTVRRGAQTLLHAPRAQIAPRSPGSAALPFALGSVDAIEPEWLQQAPASQQLESLAAGDELILRAVDGHAWRAVLPELSLRADVITSDGAERALSFALDTVIWSASDQRLSLVSRAQTPWSDAIVRVVVSVASARQGRFLTPFRRVDPAIDRPPPSSEPLAGPGTGTVTLEAKVVADARAAAATPFGGTVTLSPADVQAARARASTPFREGAAATAVAPPSVPVVPVDTGTLVADDGIIAAIRASVLRAPVPASAIDTAPPVATPVATAPARSRRVRSLHPRLDRSDLGRAFLRALGVEAAR